jgi:hypothetical protein
MTTFGALVIANGGSGGQNCDAATGAGNGGRGATQGTGSVTYGGASGLSGQFLDLASGSWYTAQTALGGWIYGGTATLEASYTIGLNGPAALGNSGAGGGGAVMNQAATGSYAGGAGASGLCIVTEYCWNDGVASACDPCGSLNVAASGYPGDG